MTGTPWSCVFVCFREQLDSELVKFLALCRFLREVKIKFNFTLLNFDKLEPEILCDRQILVLCYLLPKKRKEMSNRREERHADIMQSERQQSHWCLPRDHFSIKQHHNVSYFLLLFF